MNDLRVAFHKPCSEKWDEMQPAGCNRIGARCDKTIHNLSDLTLDEAERLMRSGEEVCVRAELDKNGVVELKPASKAPIRRMIAASVGLLALAGQAAATDHRPTTTISGTLRVVEPKTSVIATGPDGKEYRAKVKPDGRYEIKRVPAGTYQLRFAVRCYTGERGGWEGPTVTVGDSHTSLEQIDNEDFFCPIIVGMIERQTEQG